MKSSRQITRASTPWAVTILAITMVVFAVVDLTVSSAVSTFLLVPVLVSSALGHPRLTGILALIAAGLSAVLVFLRPDEQELTLPRLGLIALAGIAATGIAAIIRRGQDEQEALLRDLEESEERYRLLAENAVDVVTHIDPDGIVDYVSPSVEEVLGWAPEELEGHPWAGLVSSEEELRLTPIADGLQRETGSSDEVLTQVRHQDGTLRWMNSTLRALADDEGHPRGLIAASRDVTHEVAARTELTHRAQFDELTDVLNRRTALERLEDVSVRARQPGDQAAVLFVDLDHFKDVNDSNGHAAGDAVLQAVTQRMRDSVRAGDLVARMGGDEFVVLLDGLHDLREAQTVAHKILALCREPVETPNGPATISVSIGLAPMMLGQPVDDLLAAADEAMYTAKEHGGNRVVAVGMSTA